MKRFTDTDLWQKTWFMELLPGEKLAWLYLTSACDNVGVWSPNYKLAEFIIGASVDWDQLVENSNGNIVVMDNGKWWLVDFCRFQHPDLKEESASPAIKSYVKLLKKHGLFEQYTNSTGTVHVPYKEREREREQEREQERAREREQEKEQEPSEEKELVKRIKESFYQLQEDATVFDFKREVPHCKKLAKKALTHDDPDDFLRRLFETFLEFKRRDKFYSGQPVLPSVVNSGGIYPRLVEAMQNKERAKLTPEEAELLSGMFEGVNR